MSYIYKIINLVNNKCYIGQYSGNDPYYCGSGLLIKKAIKKYGRDSFIKGIIIEGDFTKELLNDLEKHYIRLYSPKESNTSYNLTNGGEGALGWIITEEKSRNMSLAGKKRMENPKEREKISNSLKGRKHTKEAREAMSKAMKGKKCSLGRVTSNETKEKLRKSSSGRIHTPTTRLKISLINKGRKLTEEHKEKIRKSKTKLVILVQ